MKTLVGEFLLHHSLATQEPSRFFITIMIIIIIAIIIIIIIIIIFIMFIIIFN